MNDTILPFHRSYIAFAAGGLIGGAIGTDAVIWIMAAWFFVGIAYSYGVAQGGEPNAG